MTNQMGLMACHTHDYMAEKDIQKNAFQSLHKRCVVTYILRHNKTSNNIDGVTSRRGDVTRKTWHTCNNGVSFHISCSTLIGTAM